MKASSLPNLNRETPSFPNFFTLDQDPNHHDDTTIHKPPNIDHSEDTEASETSPFKRILSPSASFNEMNENHYPMVGSFYRWDQMDRTLPRWAPSPNGSETNVSVGSNQFSGNVGALSEEPNVTQFRWEPGGVLCIPMHSTVLCRRRAGIFLTIGDVHRVDLVEYYKSAKDQLDRISLSALSAHK